MNSLRMISEVREGLVLRNSRDDCSGWEATCTGIDTRANEAYMTVQSDGSPYTWTETWNLAHTNSGLRDGTYIVVADNMETT